MAKTITTHNGSAAHRDHNIRNPHVAEKLEHIDPELIDQNEILHDEKPREAYRRIFGEALDAYNQKQTREDRKIPDYFTHVMNDKKKHPVYELIVQIGDRNDTGIDAPVERECLKEFYRGWAERNPHLECIGAYIHADESEGTLHMHVDYVPVATGYKKGMEVQSGLAKALEQQGFVKDGRQTGQILWEARENAALEAICERHGIEVVHPMTEKREHMSTQEYKAWQSVELAHETLQNLRQEADEVQAGLTAAKEETKTVRAEGLRIGLDAQKILQEAQKLQEVVSSLETKKTALEGKIEAMEGKLPALEAQISDADSRLEDLHSQISESEEEMEATDRAIKKKKEEGQGFFSGFGDMNRAIQQERAKMEQEKRMNLLETFIQQPAIKPLWEAFLRMMEKVRGKSKGHHHSEPEK